METDTGYVPSSVVHGLGPYFKTLFLNTRDKPKLIREDVHRTILLYEDKKTYR